MRDSLSLNKPVVTVLFNSQLRQLSIIQSSLNLFDKLLKDPQKTLFPSICRRPISRNRQPSKSSPPALQTQHAGQAAGSHDVRDALHKTPGRSTVEPSASLPAGNIWYDSSPALHGPRSKVVAVCEWVGGIESMTPNLHLNLDWHLAEAVKALGRHLTVTLSGCVGVKVMS